MHFGRLLRGAGLSVGPGQIMLALRAAVEVGPERREDFFWALASVFVSRHEELELFSQAFDTFWRDPFRREQLLSILLSQAERDLGRAPSDVSRRVREAWSSPQASLRPVEESFEEEVDAVLTFSPDEVLRKKDFEQMSVAELQRARELIARMRFNVADLRTRRMRFARRGAIDLRRTMRASIGSDTINLAFRTPRVRPPAIVILADISGSMERYSRMFLHFMHVLTSLRDRVHSFVFGTRLTNVSRVLRNRDVDVALAELGQEVLDWSGGTRIRSSLREFNVRWSRRVLGQGAIVLLMTDGLDRDVDEHGALSGLAFEVDRLRRSCRRLIWLNPLLRYREFRPLAHGVRILFDHVGEHRPVHDLESLESLIAALASR